MSRTIVEDLTEKNFVAQRLVPGRPFYGFEAPDNSGNMPGGAVMKMNPYAMAAKFVMSRNADEREVTHTAETIAEQIVEKLRPAATSAGAP